MSKPDLPTGTFHGHIGRTFAESEPWFEEPVHPADDSPNVVVVLLDDTGFAQLGCYGSEIQTPNLDTLAGEGLRFSQFYNTAKCHSSRVSLLTGLYCGQAGGAKLDRGATIAEVLGQAEDFAVVNAQPFPDRVTTLYCGVEWANAGLVAVQQLTVDVDKQIAVFLVEFLKHDF